MRYLVLPIHRENIRLKVWEGEESEPAMTLSEAIDMIERTYPSAFAVLVMAGVGWEEQMTMVKTKKYSNKGGGNGQERVSEKV